MAPVIVMLLIVTVDEVTEPTTNPILVEASMSKILNIVVVMDNEADALSDLNKLYEVVM